MSTFLPFPHDAAPLRIPPHMSSPSRFRLVTSAMLATGCERQAVDAVRASNVLHFPKPPRNHEPTPAA